MTHLRHYGSGLQGSPHPASRAVHSIVPARVAHQAQRPLYLNQLIKLLLRDRTMLPVVAQGVAASAEYMSIWARSQWELHILRNHVTHRGAIVGTFTGSGLSTKSAYRQR